jgi:Gram-negative bacterial TonB protein C-terminal
MRAVLVSVALSLISCVSEPPSTTPAAAGPVPMGILAICPVSGQATPTMPQEAISQNVSGTVVARVRIANGNVEDVAILSGPEVLHASIIAAMKKYKCLKKSVAVVSEQSFTFILE